jgi:hypothetical protein
LYDFSPNRRELQLIVRRSRRHHPEIDEFDAEMAIKSVKVKHVIVDIPVESFAVLVQTYVSIISTFMVFGAIGIDRRGRTNDPYVLSKR